MKLALGSQPLTHTRRHLEVDLAASFPRRPKFGTDEIIPEGWPN